MAEYIEREALVKALRGSAVAKYPASFTMGLLAAADEASKIQAAADVAPVRSGRWIHTDMAAHWIGKDECSECTYHEESRIDLSHLNYCPNCGAKMDGGQDG